MNSTAMTTTSAPHATIDTTLKSKVRLIAFCGHAGAGKSLIADFLHANYKNVWINSFAASVKDVAAELFKIPRRSFDLPSQKGIPAGPFNMSPRVAAQFVGTELGRDTFGSGFWVAHLVHTLNQLNEEGTDYLYTNQDTVLIPDLRFQSEHDWLMENNGFLFVVNRPGHDGNVGIPNHRSEQLSSITFKKERTIFIDNDANKVDLFRKVSSIFVDFLDMNDFEEDEEPSVTPESNPIPEL